MKRKIINITVILLAFILGMLLGLNFYSQYDANRDRRVNAQDYVAIKNYIMKGCDENG